MAFSVNAGAATTIFSNTFEDGNFAPEIGTWTVGAGSATTSVVTTSVASDPTLGNNVGLIDQATNSLDLTLNLASTASLTGGQTVLLDFDVAWRRTNGNTKTIFVDAVDSNGDIVTRLVLGDANAFGNGAGDRQRPGYDPTSAGAANTENLVMPAPDTPGSFWWGADSNPANGFDVIRDGHISLVIGESSFDFASTRAAGASYSTTGLSNRDGGTFADIAEFQFSSAGSNYGFYIDNVTVATVVAVPEPGSFAFIGLSVLGLCSYRRRR